MNKNVQQATIQLDPAEMGHIEVKIQQTSDGLSIQFNAQHPQVKDALESQSIRLREMIEAEVDQEVALDFKQDQSTTSDQDEQSEAGKEGADAQAATAEQVESEMLVEESSVENL